MKFKSHIVTQASGSVGGTTYAHNQAGLYMRARSIPTNPNTTFQATVRNTFRSIMNRWTNVLDGGQRAAWSNYAKNVPIKNSLGDNIIIGDNAMYLRTQSVCAQEGLAYKDSAPTIYDLGAFTEPVPTITAGSTDLSLAFTAGDSWHAPNGAMGVWAGRPQNGSVNFFKGPWRYVGAIDGTATSPAVFTLPFAAGDTASSYFLKVSSMEPDGRLSNPGFIKSTPV